MMKCAKAAMAKPSKGIARPVSIAVLIAGLIASCDAKNASLAPELASAKPAISQADCEAQAGFAFVAVGDFIAGSDKTERDYAYRITAEGFADSPKQVPKAEANYRSTGWFDHEPERRTVNLPAFCLSKNLVTNADYQAFVQATEHPAPEISAAAYQAQGFLVHDYAEVEPYLWQGDQYPAQQGQHPAVLISYEDAVAYVQWRSERDGVSYRLPSALEWEKAARGTDGRYFPWGSEWRNDATNWAKNGPMGTSAIATFPLSRSPYGIEDMAGNVFEYTSDLTNTTPAKVILKGCGWDDYPGFCRAAYQHNRPVDSKHILFGFRLLLE